MEDVGNENLKGLAETAEENGDLESRVYELGYHIIPAVSEENVSQEAAKVVGFVTKADASVISEDAPKHIELAYPMHRIENGKKDTFTTAYFGSVKFEAKPTLLAHIKESLDGNKNVLRYLIFKTVRENTRAEFRFPQVTVERRQEATQRTPLRKEEKSAPVSEEALDRSIEDLVID